LLLRATKVVPSVTGNEAAPLRIGILGAARIAPSALIKPAKGNVEVVVAAVAARDASRAQALLRNTASPGCMKATSR